MKTQSRIDVPDAGRGLIAGQTTPIAGLAWALRARSAQRGQASSRPSVTALRTA